MGKKYSVMNERRVEGIAIYFLALIQDSPFPMEIVVVMQHLA